MALDPHLYAGPVLRRSETAGITVWAAFAEARELSLVVFDATEPGRVFGQGRASTLQVLPNLHLLLVTARPTGGAAEFPVETTLGYDLRSGLDGSGESVFGGPEQRREIAYLPFEWPTVRLRPIGGPVSVLHGSCRKPHGIGLDAFGGLDMRLTQIVVADEQAPPTAKQRPDGLFLTGDQIYADDVSPVFAALVNRLAEKLTGGDGEALPWLDETTLSASRLPMGNRSGLLNALFTSSKLDDHLVSFAEYAAAYLLAWGDSAWIQLERELPVLLGDGVSTYRATIPATRRVLANVPLYAMTDDHEVTDDWNLNLGWRYRVEQHALTQRIVRNGMTAFVLFQAWGNEPERLEPLVAAAAAWTFDPDRRDDAAYGRLLRESYFGYVAPTQPRVLVMDTRTDRADAEKHGNDVVAVLDPRPPALLGPRAKAWFTGALAQLDPKAPIIVSPCPVLNLFFFLDAWQRIEQTTQFIRANAEAEFDLEFWLPAEVTWFCEQLAHTFPGATVFALSGDFHCSYVRKEHLRAGQPTSGTLVQFTSSPVKNAMDEKQAALVTFAERWHYDQYERFTDGRPALFFRTNNFGHLSSENGAFVVRFYCDDGSVKQVART